MNITSIRNTFPINQYNASEHTEKSVSGFSDVLNQAKTSRTESSSTLLELFWKDIIDDFDDKQLAERLRSEGGPEISTEKKINWKADGQSILTSEQIMYLKDSYNLSNMSNQDYYNLLSDLSNMNVLSGKDIVKLHAGGRTKCIVWTFPCFPPQHKKHESKDYVFRKCLSKNSDIDKRSLIYFKICR